MRHRDLEARDGSHLISVGELLQRLPEGVAKVVLRRGIPLSGTGHYSVQNEFRRVVAEKNISPVDKH